MLLGENNMDKFELIELLRSTATAPITLRYTLTNPLYL